MDEIIKKNKLLLVCGSGGVGKTTLSAALGIHAARLGKKVIVLTIDPAKRLATSLGISELLSTPTKIELDIDKFSGSLDAMMLDTKSCFDQLVKKYASSTDAYEKIISNRLYQHLSSMIVGSQEYMAMEALYDFYVKREYDLIIVDTPPTVHAIDFLEAPQKMTSAIDKSMLKLFLKPAAFIGTAGVKLFEKPSQMILKVLDKVIGYDFMGEMSEMLIAFQDMFSGFKKRAGEVSKLLANPDSGFILVSVCEDKSLKEAEYFTKQLKERNFELEGLLINRFFELPKFSQKKLDLEIESLFSPILSNKIKKTLKESLELSKRDVDYLKDFKALLEAEQIIKTLPLYQSDIHDLEALIRLSKQLS